MNWDEIKSAAGQFATAVCFFAAGAGLISAAQSSALVNDVTTIVGAVGAAAPAFAGLLSIATSIYRHWNMKKVPETAIVVPAKPAGR